MKKLIPRTLPAWVLIILVAVLVVSQTMSFLIMSRDRTANNEITDLYRLNERAFALAKLMAPLSGEERRRISNEVTDSTVVVNVSALSAIATAISPSDRFAELEDILVSRLSRFNVVDARVRLDPPGPVDANTTVIGDGDDDSGNVEEDLTEVARDFLTTERYTVSLQFNDGQWLNFVTPATPVGPILTRDSLPLYLIIGMGVVVLAFWAVWRLAAPYRILEAAVTRLAKDLNSAPIPEKGSKDYGSAARALNQMQARLQEYVEERELVAAALAHDLRTPVTRMRLRLALLRDSELQTALAGDIGQIERTVQSVIDFAKLNISNEPAERLDFWSFVDAVADEYDNVSLEGANPEQTRLICFAPPVALSRCIKNLIDNAIKYGRRARLSVSYSADRIALIVLDEGSGIPEAEMGKVFQPFVRLEGSRNLSTGGSGLGLAIARNLMRSFGGDISLANVRGGGLSATLTIPRIDL